MLFVVVFIVFKFIFRYIYVSFVVNIMNYLILGMEIRNFVEFSV